MRTTRMNIAVLALAAVTAFAMAPAEAQTTQPPGTRDASPCDTKAPNDAICLYWSIPTVNVDGSPTVLPIVYRVEQKRGTGSFTQIATGLTDTKLYVKNLAPGDYTFRVYANCVGAGCTEGPASNSAGRTATPPVIAPGPPSLLIAEVTFTVPATCDTSVTPARCTVDLTQLATQQLAAAAVPALR